MNDLKKILFNFYSKTLEEYVNETLWAKVIDIEKGLFKIDNIPFYAPIATEDIVYAEYDETGKFYIVEDVIEYSNNSIIQIVILNEEKTSQKIADKIAGLGYNYEILNEKYFVIEVLVSQKYFPLKSFLQKLEDMNILSFSEVCLSSVHRIN